MHPHIRIEIEGLKHQVAQYFNTHSTEFNGCVKESLDRMLTEEWVREEIDQAIRHCLGRAIESVASSIQLQEVLHQHISGLVLDQLEAKGRTK